MLAQGNCILPPQNERHYSDLIGWVSRTQVGEIAPYLFSYLLSYLLHLIYNGCPALRYIWVDGTPPWPVKAPSPVTGTTRDKRDTLHPNSHPQWEDKVVYQSSGDGLPAGSGCAGETLLALVWALFRYI